ncbi:hypothetical protein ACFPU1_04850 [Thalassorhabdus alkalitolerans]|uniref:Uncharacterized protein n=1 Tax=Thalassorhabdus alkalitolerans TaxID=2282697 RepID=A0ABW0YI60_9BACI
MSMENFRETDKHLLFYVKNAWTVCITPISSPTLRLCRLPDERAEEIELVEDNRLKCTVALDGDNLCMQKEPYHGSLHIND